MENKAVKLGKMTIARYMLYALIAVVLVTGGSFARYTTKGPALEDARVAEFDVSIALNGWSNNDVSTHAMGENKVYSYTVTNNSEVAVQVRLVVDSYSGLEPQLSSSGWFVLAAGGDSDDVTVTIAGDLIGNGGGNVVQMHMEYEQID